MSYHGDATFLYLAPHLKALMLLTKKNSPVKVENLLPTAFYGSRLYRLIDNKSRKETLDLILEHSQCSPLGLCHTQ